MRTWVALGVGLTALLGFAPSAGASVGVGIQANPVRLTGVAHPGATYTLPSLYVVNTGTQAESITVQVERLGNAHSGRAIPRSWINVSGLSGQLGPGQAADIPLQLVTPSDARPGSYSSDLVVTGSTALTTNGIRFGAAAATGLDFSITPAPAPGFPTWKLWMICALVVLGGATFVVRRTGLRIRIEHRGS
jgi:hypothetical protein